jgi:hypothetical protein
MRTPTSYGICEACGSRASKAAMMAHLRKCLAAKTGDVPSGGLLFRVQSPGASMFWLDCAATPEAKLKDLDNLLRRTWLECCGHLSDFSGAGRRKLPRSTTIGRVFAASAKRLDYEYDFGSTTALVITSSGIVDAHRGKPVRVVARNEAPTWHCDHCGQPATTICAQCLYDGRGFCCAVHAKKHSCGEEMLLPVVNSPRMGVCGYTGEG